MDPLRYSEYNYKVSNNLYPYDVKNEQLLHENVKQNQTATTNIQNSIQDIPNLIQNFSMPTQHVPSSLHNVPDSSQHIRDSLHHDPRPVQNIPSSIENFPHVMNVAQNSQLPMNMQNIDNTPQCDTNNILGGYGSGNPCDVGNDTVPVESMQDTDAVEDSKEDLKPLIAAQANKGRRRKKPRGKVSSYWNKKITDSNFPFYGCAICNISFTALHELDQHVPIHKGRLTSYELRLKNQRKRKLLKKQSKKLKKLSKKVKKEGDVITTTTSFEIEIKPEDGYIGNEKAAEYVGNANGRNESNDAGSDLNEQRVQENGKADEKQDRDGKTGFNEGTSEEKHNADVKDCKVGKGYAGKDEKLGIDDPRLQKLFKCFACQKQFSLGYYLKLHVRSHTDEKPYTCAQCGQSFITASKLGRHNKRIHLAIRYQCRVCYRLFTRFEYLVRHFDKKHAEQKLEGEPYDFNAILPYLKELEEQLMQKVETKDVKEPKAETQDWGEVKQDVAQMWGDVKPDGSQVWRQEIKQDENSLDSQPLDIFLQPTVNVVVDEVEKVDIEVKIEKEDLDYEMKDENFHNDDNSDRNVDSIVKTDLKDESVSDEDYFPSNTWTAPVAEPPVPEKRPLKRKDFPVQCEFCDKTISTLTYMKVHLRTHTGERPFKCYICGRGFITSSKMHRHVLTHGDVPIEDEKLDTEGVKEEPDKAEDCGEATEGKKKGRKKKRKMSQGANAKKKYQPRPHACSFCNKRFLHIDTLKVHQKSHEGEVRILKCNFCLEEQPDEETLKTHEATHTGPRPYLCTVCSRTYTKKESMVYHKKSHYADAERKTFVCDICSKTFNEQCKLQRHIVSHRTDKYTLRYECPVCAHMFHTRYHVEMHLSSHLKEGTISEHNRSEILAMVLQNARKIPRPGVVLGAPPPEITPSDERSTVCNICGEVFQHFYFLEDHLKSHGSKIAIEDLNKKEDEVKKHVCPVCNKGFKLPYYLKLHSFTHTKEKPYICQQCGKGFITKGKLKRHLESHTGLKKYQCHICYKFFTRPSYQRIHVRTIHGTQDYNFRLDTFGKQFDGYSENSN